MTNRIKIVETLKRIFDHNNTLYSVFLFLFGTAALTWFFDALGYWVKGTVPLFLWLIGGRELPIEYRDTLGDALLQTLGPAIVFGVVLVLAFKHYKSNRPPKVVHHVFRPVPHKGLILMLSTYFHRKEGTDDVSKLLALMKEEKSYDEVRAYALGSNWGPMVVALEHHATALENCWLVCTCDAGGRSGSSHQFEAAEKVVKFFSNKRVQCRKGYEGDGVDPNHVQAVAEMVDTIFQDAVVLEIDEKDIMSDFTGGTAAMTAGMILSTLAEDRHVQYLSQLTGLFNEEGNARPQLELVRMKVLEEVRTSFEDVKGKNLTLTA